MGSLVLGGIMMMLLWASVANADGPTYAPQPAELLQVRDGLGNFLTKAQAGGEVRVAYFGGSITAAAGWRVKTLQWLRDAHPQTTFTEINAAIGGTGSDLGVYRFQQDVLSRRPGLVFVEFAVNDGGAPPDRIWKAFDGIVRQAWRQDPAIDFCFVYTFCVGYEADLGKGLCPPAAGADEMLAEHYGIPAVNVALRTVQLAGQGKLIYVPAKDAEGKEQAVPDGVIKFSDDGVHPLDQAHQIYADLIDGALSQMTPLARPQPHQLRAPFIAENWEAAKLVPLRTNMLTAGWRKLAGGEGLGGAFGSFMPEMWQADRPGERISFRFKGTSAGLYDLVGPDGAQVMITVDGQTRGPVPRFDSYCSYHRLATLPIADGLPDAVHAVTVEIHPDQPDRRSVTDVERGKPGFDPKRYDGTVLRVGSIMLIGEIVEE
jgi:hypothetical protein